MRLNKVEWQEQEFVNKILESIKDIAGIAT